MNTKSFADLSTKKYRFRPSYFLRDNEKGVASDKETGKPIHISTIQSLQNKALIQYLRQRGISIKTASACLTEIHYELQTENDLKKYFALAFPNDSNGYERRNLHPHSPIKACPQLDWGLRACPQLDWGTSFIRTGFKGSIGQKDISSLPKEKRRDGNGETESSAVTVFEGFIDFLSALCFYRVKEAKTFVIVLSSVSLTDRAIEKIRSCGFKKVYLYLDRDDAAHRMGAHFRKQVSKEIAILDKSDLYTGYKDFNELLVKTKAENSP